MIKFSSYQDTHTPWIGEIPTGWSLKSLKHIFTEKKSTKNSDLGCGSISFGKVIYKDDEKIPESTKESYQEVLDGEFLINPLNLNYDLKSLRIGLSRINVVVSQGYIVLKIKDGFVPEYYEYLLRKFDVEHMKSLGQGVRQTISYTHLKDEKLVVPPVDEQNRISRYLDKKTSLIDSLINKIEKRIELLKEQRISLVNQYVTKGLDPNVEMKDSGIEWIGKIPKHWDIKRVSTLYSQSSIRGFEDEENLSVFRDYGVVRRVDHENKNVLSEDLSTYKLVNKGDLVLNKMKTWMGSLGVSEYRGIVSPAYYVLRPNFEFFSGYLHHLLRSKVYIDQYASVSKGVRPGQWDLSIDSFMSLNIILPPLEEQKEIHKALTTMLSKNTRMIDLEGSRIEKLNEYRQSLISSVVTGKFKITEEKP